MNDMYARYEQGLTRLLKRLETDHDRYIEALVLQSRFNISAAALRAYGEKDPGEQADFFRIIKQLHILCLATVGMDFDKWCDRYIIEEQDDVKSDPWYPYIGNLEALQDGNLQYFLRRKLAEQGIHINTKRTIPEEDSIERFRIIPLHAMILYTSQDPIVSPYIQKYWDDLESLFRDICEIYVSVAQLNGSENANDAISSSYILKKFGFHAYTLLPGIFFWDLYDDSEFVSFGRNASETEITYLCRQIFEKLVEDPSIAAIRRAKEIIDQSRRV
jgi:hypothetical protein